MSLTAALKRLSEIPLNAWHYSQKRPIEAGLYGGGLLLCALFAKVAISIVGIALISGSFYALLMKQ